MSNLNHRYFCSRSISEVHLKMSHPIKKAQDYFLGFALETCHQRKCQLYRYLEKISYCHFVLAKNNYPLRNFFSQTELKRFIFVKIITVDQSHIKLLK